MFWMPFLNFVYNLYFMGYILIHYIWIRDAIQGSEQCWGQAVLCKRATKASGSGSTVEATYKLQDSKWYTQNRHCRAGKGGLKQSSQIQLVNTKPHKYVSLSRRWWECLAKSQMCAWDKKTLCLASALVCQRHLSVPRVGDRNDNDLRNAHSKNTRDARATHVLQNDSVASERKQEG